MNTADEVVSIKMPAGTTFARAKEILYFECLANQKKIDNAVLKLQVKLLEERTSYEEFLKSCKGPVQIRNDTISRLGLKGPPGLGTVSTDVADKSIESLYASAVNGIAEELEKAQQLREQKQKKHEELVLAVSKRNPKELFKQAVLRVMRNKSSMVDDVGAWLRASKADGVDDSVMDPRTRLAEFVSAPKQKAVQAKKKRQRRREIPSCQPHGKGAKGGSGKGSGTIGGGKKGKPGKGKGKGKGRHSQKGGGKSTGGNGGKGHNNKQQPSAVWKNKNTDGDAEKASKWKGKGKGKGKGKW
jgi:hypothetical protein